MKTRNAAARAAKNARGNARAAEAGRAEALLYSAHQEPKMIKKTSRAALVDCPACDGERGEYDESYAGYDSHDGPAVKETWIPCHTCGAEGKVTQVERLAWLIGLARSEEEAVRQFPAELTWELVREEAGA